MVCQNKAQEVLKNANLLEKNNLMNIKLDIVYLKVYGFQ